MIETSRLRRMIMMKTVLITNSVQTSGTPTVPKA
jgi:hypothetical protein